MKKWNQFLTIGIVGLAISIIFFFGLRLIGVDYDLTPYALPWIVFLIIGVSKRKYVAN